MENKDINILISTVYNSVEFVDEFIETRDKLKINGKIITSDLRNNVPAAIGDKHVKLKPIDDEGYIDSIIDVCNKENVSVFIPRVDKELKLVSENKDKIEKFTSSKVMISHKNVIDIARDKVKTYEFLINKGFSTPRIISDDDIKNNNYSFPLYIKPIDGTSSKNNFKINNEDELNFFKNYVENNIIQEFIEGDDYTIDVFCDFDGNPLTIIPKLRMVINDGCISEGMVIKNRKLVEVARRLIDELNEIGRIVGGINIDCMICGEKVYIIEINARFGEGYPIAYKAGVNCQEKIYRLMNGEKLRFDDEYEDNVKVIRYSKFKVVNK